MYGFGKSHYLQLALQPDELIRELYNDPIILKRHTGEIKLFPGNYNFLIIKFKYLFNIIYF